MFFAVLVLSVAAASAAFNCSAGVRFPDSDFCSTRRCAAYPNGLAAASPDVCCAACAGAADCVGWTWGTWSGPPTCYPVAFFEAGCLAPRTGHVVGEARAPPSPSPVPPPPEWAAKIAAGDMLYSGAGDADIPSDKLPMVGNGFLAGQLMADAVFVAGIFAGQGLEAGSHRARVPATAAVAAPGAPGPAALDVREATYFRRSVVAPRAGCAAGAATSCTTAAGPVTVEQRWYAHRALPSALVMEVAVVASASAPPPPGGGVYVVLALANAAGPPSPDINFTAVPVAPDAPFAAVAGWTQGTECPPGACGDVVTAPFRVAVLTTPLPASLAIDAADAGRTIAFLTVIRTSIETAAAAVVDAAAADFAAALDLAAAGTLRATHVAEWAATVWTSGFSVDRLDVARAVNTSLYSIVSSLRADRPFSTSPGGLANDGYNGHCEFWRALRRRGGASGGPFTHPPLTPHPPLSSFCSLLGLRDLDVADPESPSSGHCRVHAPVPRQHAARRALQGNDVLAAARRCAVQLGECDVGN